MDDRVMRAKEILGLRRVPIKIGFLEAPPAALARWAGGPVAAGCVFWDRAMDGKSFYTLPSDHWNCAVGSHTHKIGLPPDRAGELGATVSFMVETRYLDPAEVAGIPTLEREPGAVAYAPATSDAFRADVVLMALTPAQSTLVYEAALKAGLAHGPAGASSRPSCGHPAGGREDRGRGDLLRLPRQPHVHDHRRRRDVPGRPGRPLGRPSRSPGGGAALEPHDGELLPGAGRQVRRAEISAVVLPAEAVKAAARASRFTLVGLARAEPLDPAPLSRWLDAGYAADMTWMARRMPERLDPGAVLPGARTVIALAIAYHRPAAEAGTVARYARGRDYHYAHRDRMRALRGRLLGLDPSLETYAAVDTGLAMEKVWAERAGLGWIGKNGCLIHPRLGSWLTLSVMLVDRAVDGYDAPAERRCGDCTLCLGACPTGAFPAPGVVDARRCIAYHSIENHGTVPEAFRPGFSGRIFGCDVCQEVCPFNRREQPEGDARFAPRPLAGLSPAEVAALGEDDFDRLASGMALARARHDGLRRNALYAIGNARDRAARPVVAGLTDDRAPSVRDAARWALGRLDGDSPSGT